MRHGQEIKRKVIIPGLDTGFIETLVIEEVGDGWVAVRPHGSDDLLVFGEHPDAIAPLADLDID